MAPSGASADHAATTKSLEWKPLDPESLVAAPCLIEQTLCCYNDDQDQPQLAKDVDYAKAVLEAWKAQDLDATWRTEWASVTYYDDDDNNTPLYGHLVRNSQSDNDANNDAAATTAPTAGILLLHTGAGPHDLFLLWKAAALVNTLNSPHNNVGVLIADLLSDESGWAWNADDRSRYLAARDALLRVKNDDDDDDDDGGGTTIQSRPVLERRLRAAVTCLEDQLQLEQSPGVDDPEPNDIRIAALGWCFGGHAVAELARLRLPNVRAMATFHGVFDGIPAIDDDGDKNNKPISSEILICHGVLDPFVPNGDLEKAL